MPWGHIFTFFAGVLVGAATIVIWKALRFAADLRAARHALASYVFYAGLDLFSFELFSRVGSMGLAEAVRSSAPHLRFVPIVFLGSTIDYALALWIDRTEEPSRRKLALVVTILMNTGLLLVFKYWDFLAEQVVALGGPDGRLGRSGRDPAQDGSLRFDAF